MNSAFYHSRSFLSIGLSAVFFSCMFVMTSAQTAEDRQSLQDIKDTAKQFLTQESTSINVTGTVVADVGDLDPRLNLAQCASLEPFMPPGSHLWGKTSIGVRCLSPQRWTVYVPGTVKIWGTYYITNKSIAQGQTITESDISAVKGELTSLASGIVTEAGQAVGHVCAMSLAAGIPLRQDGLRLQQVVVQGQSIRLISIGAGFKVSTEAQALNGASEGQLVKVKTDSGQVVSGIAKIGGVVEVNSN